MTRAVRIKPKVSEGFVRIRLLCVHILYFLLLFILGLLLFVYLVPSETAQIASALTYDTVIEDTTYTVRKVTPVRDMQNKQGVLLTLVEEHRCFDVLLYDEKKVQEVSEGTVYIGRKCIYSAYADSMLIARHINDTLYIAEQGTKYMTFDEFKAEAENIWTTQYISNGNIRYRYMFIAYACVLFFILLLLMFISYKNRMRKYRYNVLQKHRKDFK